MTTTTSASDSRYRRIALFAVVFPLAFLAALYIQQRSGSRSAELSGYQDEAAHYITGLMVRDYLLHGWQQSPPIPFAEEYYLHYPKVAIGHWPPVYYFVQFVWTAVFPTTISSLLNLQAVLLAAISAIMFLLIRSRFGWLAAATMCAVFLILYRTQVLASEVMAEPLLALFTLLATWAIAGYFETGGRRYLIWFVVFVELAAHTKGSGLALIGLPVLLAACLGRLDEFRKWTFWLAHLAMAVILIPWQLLTWKMVHNGMDSATIRVMAGQARDFIPIMGMMFGWPLLIAIVCGAYFAITSRKHPDPLLASCAIAAVLTFVLHSVSPNGAEERRLFMAVPGALILAPAAVWRAFSAWNLPRWAPVALLAMAAISILPVLTSFHKVTVGYRAVCGWLLGNAGPGQAILIASDTDGEGMLVSEVGQSQPRPTMYIVRGIKLLEDCDWNGADCHATVADPIEAQKVLDSIPIRYVVMDHFTGTPSRNYVDLLRRTIVARPDLWTLRNTLPANSPEGGHGEIEIYQRLGPVAEHVHVWVNLRRMLGRVIQQ